MLEIPLEQYEMETSNIYVLYFTLNSDIICIFIDCFPSS